MLQAQRRSDPIPPWGAAWAGRGQTSRARSTDSLDGSAEGSVQPAAPTGGPSVKGKPGKRLSAPRGPFPRLADCAHFHYENVDFGHIQLLLSPEREGPGLSGENELVFGVQVTCQGRSWPVLRSYDDFRSLDAHLHRCIFDRRFSCLPELPPPPEGSRAAQMLVPLLLQYLETLSGLVDSNLNCGPVLTWMELDNHGRRLLLSEEASLNVPAVAAAHVVKRYTAQAPDELSFEVGDIVSVIDMPPTEDRSWWRGKRGFQVGFFPSECVELFTERPGPGLKTDADGPLGGIAAPQGVSALTSAVPRPRGKLAGLLRTFMRSRPSRQRLRQRGILRQRVFGCDLGEHLSNSGQDVPQVLRCCSEFIEAHGVVDGIYRLSGVSSNIQRLRHEFDSERIPELSGPAFLQDIHSVSSLCKLYFRELPNPLLTYQLYGKFSEAMSVPGEEERLVRVHDVIQQLPPPHYRTLEYLLRHLARMARHSANTSMHARNLAIVWAPNLLRSMELESVGLGGAAAFREVRVQSVVVEFLLTHVEVLFSDTFTSAGLDPAGRCLLPRPKSLAGSGPSTRLLTLEEAQARTQGRLGTPTEPAAPKMQASPVERRKRERGEKQRKPGGSSWKTFFALGRGPSVPRKKPLPWLGGTRAPPQPSGTHPDTVTLRSAKSEESLSSQASGAGLQRLHRLRRPHSSSDAFPVGPAPAGSCESLSSSSSSSSTSSSSSSSESSAAGLGPLSGSPSHRTSAWLDDGDELDFSPPRCLEGLRGLDFDPLTFRCSSPTPGDPAPPASPAPPAPASAFPPRPAPQTLSPHGPANSASPTALDISEPLAVSVPPAVLELLGAGGAPASVSPTPALSPGPGLHPHMVPLLLSDTCQQEVGSKVALPASRGAQAQHGPGMESPLLPPPLALLRPGGAPPPPPKNPARLMALALAERALQVAEQQSQQERGGTPPAPRSPFRRSLSLEVGGEPVGTPGSGLAPHSLAHLGAWAPGPSSYLPRQQSDGSLVRSLRPLATARRGLRGPAQVSTPPRAGGAYRDSPEASAQSPCSIPSQGSAAGFFSSPPRECLPPFFGVPKPSLYPLGPPSFQPSSPAPAWRNSLGPPTPLDRGENLYYEIGGASEGSPYRCWSPFRSMPPDRLNASYGMLGQSPPLHRSPDFLLNYPPSPSCFPPDHLGHSAPQHPARRLNRPEPLYVNLAPGPRGPSPDSSCSSSPPTHPRSRSDPGLPAPRLPQKQRVPWGPRTPHRVPGPWGPPEPLLLYRAAPPPYGRGGEHHRGSLYRNGGQRGEGAGPPPPYPTPSWSLQSEGQTRSYC
ncbi:rho GTPase-activating protein 33 isoform X2 [Perognathus longimembris pacificus]|uniref:rho GTPase-activating protein 33 isoform X2 n=1 Tax=Perognathus longimembris pacificus TaxID=214514 RepID=UPI002018874F|nr:rho GTPase-activating protein 33 isoform X2 [Perognathus longimembris pacificus]